MGPVTVTTSIASNSQFALGVTTVTVTATDGKGNVQTATVRAFNTAEMDKVLAKMGG